jgi:hypothetical protein
MEATTPGQDRDPRIQKFGSPWLSVLGGWVAGQMGRGIGDISGLVDGAVSWVAGHAVMAAIGTVVALVAAGMVKVVQWLLGFVRAPRSAVEWVDDAGDLAPAIRRALRKVRGEEE